MYKHKHSEENFYIAECKTPKCINKVPDKLPDIKEENIRIKIEFIKPVPQYQIRSPAEVADLMAKISERDREELWALYLDIKNKLTGVEMVCRGSLTKCATHPREIFKAAYLTNSSRIILAHNHPTGDPEPSSEDVLFSERIKKASKYLGIKLLDHIIIGRDKYVSLRAKGYIQ